MKINFRQGIVSDHPSFLTYNSGNNTITIATGTQLVRSTAAFKTLNYLIEEREDSVDAWGPLQWNSTWGPAPVGPFNSYLYWDISQATGQIRRGFSPRAPIFAASEPLSPEVDLHWFDKINNVMKYWDGTIWRTVIRVFAGWFAGGSNNITEYDLGSQVDITYSGTEESWPDHGYILYGIDMKGIRNGADASFITTTTPLLTNHGSFSSPIRLELSNAMALADEPIPAFYAVSSNGDGTVSLASGTNISKKPIGIITTPAVTGDAVDIVFKGIVYNDQWNWDPLQGRDLYCGPTGLLYQGPLGPSDIVRVGVVLDTRSALIDIDTYGSSIGGVGGVDWPLQAPTLYNNPGVVPFSFEDATTTGMQLSESGTPAHPILNLKRDDSSVLRLTSTNGSNNIVEVDENAIGVQLSNAANANVHDQSSDLESFRGIIRSVDGYQTKLELNAGAGERELNTDGAIGFQAVTPYQHQVWGPDYLNEGFSEGVPLDFSVGNSIVYYLDPFNEQQALINPVNGFAGGSYELILKLAHASPTVSAHYPYPQNGGIKGFVGPLLITGLSGLRGVAVWPQGYASNNLYYWKLQTGRPRQITTSNIGYDTGEGFTPGVGTGNPLPICNDSAFVLTTGNSLEVLGDNGYGWSSRMIGALYVGDFPGPGVAEQLPMSQANNSPLQQDGEMWMNKTTNQLYVYGVGGDVWWIDSSTNTPTEADHISLPNNGDTSTVPDGRVLAISGSESVNFVFVLMQAPTGELKLFRITGDLVTTDSITLIASGDFQGYANSIVVDDNNLIAYITLPEPNTNSVRVMAVNFNGTLSIEHNELFALSIDHTATPPVKFEPAMRGTHLYIPHKTEVLDIDVSLWTRSSWTGFAAWVDRLVLDERSNNVFGTADHSFYNTKTDGNTANQCGLVMISLSGLGDYIPGRQYTYVTTPTIPWVSGTVANYAALPINADMGAIFRTLDDGLSYLSDGTGTWERINDGVLLTETHGLGLSGERYDQIAVVNEFFNDLRSIVFPTTNVPSYPSIDTSSRYDLRFPPLVSLPAFDYTRTVIFKMTKVAASADTHQDQNGIWYITGIHEFVWPE